MWLLNHLLIKFHLFQGISLFKTDLDNLTSPEAAIAAPVMQVLHKLSHEVFKNLSHALELPWERYLGEMHEFNAQGQDELQILMQNESIPNRWSTLVRSTQPQAFVCMSN